MLYSWYEMGHAAVKPARAAADTYRFLLNHPMNPLAHTAVGRGASAAFEVFERSTRRYPKPRFGVAETIVDDEIVPVVQETVLDFPFCKLLRFRRLLDDDRGSQDPRVVLVAPMSGHYATLLRGTVESLLPDHDVYITDWVDARDVPMISGHFDLDTYIDYMIEMFEYFGGDVHVVAVCQPSVPVLAAIAHMEMNDHPDVPSTMTLMGGPIDTRINPTVVNMLAEKRGTDWFKRNVITTVPWPHRGFGRRVYPGFLQLTGFMTMNLDRHLKAHKDLFLHLVRGDGDSADKHKEFYDEYLAVMDLTAEFYLQTVDTVFVKHALPKGEMMYHDHELDLGAIKRVALLTIEGEKDDITGCGQCAAAIDLCSGIPQRMKMHYEQPDVGHYGIFNGSRFRAGILPRMAEFIRKFERFEHTRAPHPDARAVHDRTGDRPEDAEIVPPELAWGNTGMLDWFGLAPNALRQSALHPPRAPGMPVERRRKRRRKA